MRIAIIDQERVVSIIEAETYPGYGVNLGDQDVDLGDLYVAGVFNKPPISQEEQSRRDAQESLAQARASVKTDSFVRAFVAMSPEQVTNYVTNNVTDLASAKGVINKLALMLLLLAKREYGGG
ncbi:MAG: hypothetical protein ACOYZ7_08935 [Chloroflexota bacterium]